MSILEIDVGNSRIKWRFSNELESTESGFVSSTEENREHQLSGLITRLKPSLIRLSSVGENSVAMQVQQLAQVSGARFFEARTLPQQAGVTCGYDTPETMGVDRWLAILAAWNRFKNAVVVVDLGSAATVDLVLSDGSHLGGYIVPGLTMMRSALIGGTAKVRPSFPERLSTDPGNTTADAVNNGIALLLEAMIRESAEKILFAGQEPEVVLTGGDAELLATVLDCPYHLLPDLVLDGLALADDDAL